MVLELVQVTLVGYKQRHADMENEVTWWGKTVLNASTGSRTAPLPEHVSFRVFFR